MTRRTRKPPERSDAADAFLPEPDGHRGPVDDDLAEYLGESFLATATGGEDGGEALQEGVVVEELGGPFVRSGRPSGSSRRS